MSIRAVILGFLSWKPCTGYELKKLFEEGSSFHWSGNNNQIYPALVSLHRDGAIRREAVMRESKPAKNVYTITEKGMEELRTWVAESSEAPDFRAAFHARLAWADLLDEAAIGAMFASYEETLVAEILMLRERERRSTPRQEATSREILFWKALAERRVGIFEDELAWLRKLRSRFAGARL